MGKKEEIQEQYWDVHSGGVVNFTRMMRGNRATVARIHFGHGEHDVNVEVHGEALLHPGDKRNDEIGDLLALGRAYSALGRALQKRASGLVKHADDIRQGST